ncbi:MAG: prepilin-type N-terminal cleavage/methylation domain-containing protein [Planctomycetes bacterium]|nr:prepilin-type N-terminal cleavage/methylation domain-containing protein [Planctomycetota bacterium]
MKPDFRGESASSSGVGHRGGFTLIELMLSMFLVAIMMSIVYGVVVSTIEAQERVEDLMAGSEIGPTLMNFIRQDLEAAFVPDKDKDYFVGIDRKSSTGDHDRVDFLAAVTSYGAEDALAEARFHTINEVGYQVSDSSERPGLGILYRREDYWMDAEPVKGGRLTDLYDRVTMFDVQYWDGGEWIVDWSSQKKEGKLPEAIRVTLKLQVPDRQAESGFSERTYALTITLPR